MQKVKCLYYMLIGPLVLFFIFFLEYSGRKMGKKNTEGLNNAKNIQWCIHSDLLSIGIGLCLTDKKSIFI